MQEQDGRAFGRPTEGARVTDLDGSESGEFDVSPGQGAGRRIGGHRSMAKGIIPLKAFREVYGTTDREQIRSALFDAFTRAIRSKED